MPRHADHEQRRRQIAEAVWQLAAEQGLEDVSLRRVAETAGVSMRLVQYYFGTRANLLLGALELLNSDAEQSARDRMGGATDGADPRTLVRHVLHELLPLDADRRRRHLVYAAYFVRFLHDEDLAGIAGLASPTLEDLLVHLMQPAVADEIDVRAEAEILVALTQGLQAQMLLGHTDALRAVVLIDHQLDRVFGR